MNEIPAHIRGIPSVVVLKDGSEQERVVGLVSKRRLVNFSINNSRPQHRELKL
jgi:hypothetical protein